MLAPAHVSPSLTVSEDFINGVTPHLLMPMPVSVCDGLTPSSLENTLIL